MQHKLTPKKCRSSKRLADDILGKLNFNNPWKLYFNKSTFKLTYIYVSFTHGYLFCKNAKQLLFKKFDIKVIQQIHVVTKFLQQGLKQVIN